MEWRWEGLGHRPDRRARQEPEPLDSPALQNLWPSLAEASKMKQLMNLSTKQRRRRRRTNKDERHQFQSSSADLEAQAQ